MTIGEKIAKLRTSLDISQEQLAERLSVSRQAVSKWEMDQSLPQIDKVLLLCELFGVSADALLKDEIGGPFGCACGKTRTGRRLPE